MDTIPTAPTVFIIYMRYFLTRYFCTPYCFSKERFLLLKNEVFLKGMKMKKKSSSLFKSHITPYVLQIVLDYCRNLPSCGLGTPPSKSCFYVCTLQGYTLQRSSRLLKFGRRMRKPNKQKPTTVIPS